MRRIAIAAFLGGAMISSGAAAFDHEAGVPLAPAEAAGGWTLSTNDRPVCTLTLGRRGQVRAEGSCSEALAAQPIRWAPTPHGMRLIGGGGQTVVSFDRWSNSLFVSDINDGKNLQLRRGS